MKKNRIKTERRNKIRRRIRSTITGTAERPRLAVFKSSKHIYLQLINDRENVTITSVSSTTADLRSELADKSKVEAAHLIGQEIAKAAIDMGIKKVVFDRGGYKYHGVVKSAADGAREGGLDL
ncbi:50S ribosomal protein L18 [Rhodohalobacter sp. SW132]|uniref:50S ribosomal protein L18 n=1 Tax=Rhodohalobacter sp. SW132 TaxID=2293433 RepID=UPI000E272735|nr:50S ribosomal protein L18 [Rhodohalobacter sp. SW132]REL23961.1 50S ribosomal protein L18 [Rhodohalobacter sp. SW132]